MKPYDILSFVRKEKERDTKGRFSLDSVLMPMLTLVG